MSSASHDVARTKSAAEQLAELQEQMEQVNNALAGADERLHSLQRSSSGLAASRGQAVRAGSAPGGEGVARTPSGAPQAGGGLDGCGAGIESCLIMTKAGRCVLNCISSAAAAAARRRESRLVVGQLCKLLVTMHAFAGSAFLSYVEIEAHGVVLVDGGSFLVALLCSAQRAGGAIDLPSLKLRAVQIRHAFATLHTAAIEQMQATHAAELEQMLKNFTIHSDTNDADNPARQLAPSTAPAFAHFEELYLRGVLEAPPYDSCWLAPLLKLDGVRQALLLDLQSAAVLLSARGELGAAVAGGGGEGLLLPKRRLMAQLQDYGRKLHATAAVRQPSFSSLRRIFLGARSKTDAKLMRVRRIS
eukprot:SAG11_NODE_173_length_13507_cov_10.489931_2_plen_360_part_00